MSLPSKLKNYNLSSDGASYLGVAAELTLPKITMQAEEYRGGGMLGQVDIDLGLQKLTMEHKYGGLVVGVLRQLGAFRADGVLLRFNGAYQEDGAGAVTAAELVVRGRHTEVDPGTAKGGEDTEWTVQSTLTYLKWTIASRVEVEIDMLNCIYVVGGIDRMAEIRSAMGL